MIHKNNAVPRLGKLKGPAQIRTLCKMANWRQNWRTESQRSMGVTVAGSLLDHSWVGWWLQRTKRIDYGGLSRGLSVGAVVVSVVPIKGVKMSM